MKLLLLLFLGLSHITFSLPTEILKPFSTTKTPCGLTGVDYIYLINLDKRKEKLQKSLSQLNSYKITPYRFSAVNGWSLSQETLDKVGVILTPHMQISRWACQLKAHPTQNKEIVFLDNKCYGHPFTSLFLSPGAVGCFLSHLTIIKNAYDAKYTRVWILEDDFKVVQDPHCLTQLLGLLDQKVGSSNWDLLYTDLDHKDKPMYFEVNDFKSELKGLDLAWFWRPDMVPNRHSLYKRTVIDENFIKVGSRMRTHSYIINRTGMKKILDFYQTHGFYVPYDHELGLIPNLNLYSLIYDVVTFEETVSDTRGH